MKLIKSLTGAKIIFRHSADVVYKILHTKQIPVPDDHAAVIVERLGGQVSVQTLKGDVPNEEEEEEKEPEDVEAPVEADSTELEAE